MATPNVRTTIPASLQVGVLIVLVVSLAYALFIGTLLAWVGFVLTLAMLALVTFLVYLFYRLVIAVERIAANA